ncbi:MAG: PEP-CTERM sorting domain-containing protein, partial [Pirellulaceae bacterium]|nr:PEP-CTERM sorting domain-containing protein [Pirellulaceae bacterium]
IVDASFTLFAQRDNIDGSAGPSVDGEFTLALHRLDAPFVEGEVNWTSRAADEPWNTPGGDFDNVPLATLTANPYRLLTNGPSYTWSSDALIAAVQASFDEGKTLDLLARSPDGETQEHRVVYYFHSDDALDPASHPLLLVTYTTVPGDANADGRVDDADTRIVAAHWGDGPATWAMGDFNGDGGVGAADAAILAANWGHPIDLDASGATVPEPGIGILLGAGALLTSLIRRRPHGFEAIDPGRARCRSISS